MKLRIVLIFVLVLGTILADDYMSKGKKVAYNARTGITTYGEKDPAADPNATADEAAVAAPSTATSFAPVNSQVHPRDNFFGFQYDYSPEELAQLGYQYVPESVVRQRGRFGQDDYSTRETVIPGHYIDPTRFAPLRRPGDDSDLPDWMFSQRVRNGDDFDIVRNPLVVDPFRVITPGNLDELRQYGLWQNLSDPNAPLYAGLRAQGITPSPYQMANLLLLQGGLGLQTTPEQWAAAFDGMQVTPELAAAIRQRLEDIARNNAKNSGGMLGNGGFLGTGISTGNSTLDQALSFGQGAQMAGNVGGTIATGNFDSSALGDAALQDALTLGSAGLGPTVSGFAGGGMLGTLASGAAGGGLNALLHGENSDDVLQGALAGAATAGGTRLGGQVLAHFFPAEAPPAPSTSTSLAESSDPFKRRGMLPLLAQADTGTMTDVDSMMADALGITPDKVIAQPFDIAQESTDAAMAQALGIPQPDKALAVPFDAFGASLPENFLNGPGPSEQVREPTPEEQRATEMSKTVERFAKFGRALAELHGGRGTPEDAPQRQDGQSDEQYAQSLVQYANLDPQVLADQGLTPGTPAYYQFVMDQMDRIINQVTNGMDENGKDLASQLRTKTREELDALERALFVRGQIGQLMSSGKYTDPFTGISEDVIAPEGSLLQPSLAAYTRGLARSADELATMAPGDARRYIGGMLGRDVDLFGMQQRADQRERLAELLAQNDPLKRRRGLFGDALPFFSDFDPRELAALQALLG